jgi:exodeoxyribonuclease VII small subunit
MPPKAKTVANETPSEMPWNYEGTVAQIEAIVTQLERGDLPLAEVFEKFEAAVSQLRQCETFLQAKQKQADLLIETLEDKADF